MEKSCDNLCKYFLHGACSKGSACSFTHDFKAKKDQLCKFYQSGVCSYGNKCRYDHVRSQKVIKPVLLSNDVSIKTVSTLSRLNAIKTSSEPPENWVDAPSFVPGKKSHYTTTTSNNQVVEPSIVSYSSALINNLSITDDENAGLSYEGSIEDLLCPFAAVRECPYGDSCEYLHGDICDMCRCQCLHPTDYKQRKEHEDICSKRVESEMEVAFAAQRSGDVSCCICLDIVKEKRDLTERVFGLLENCTHAFCLSCIRKWRCSYLEQTVVRSCPICRVTSWFITPSEFWIEDNTEKKSCIDNYKSYLGSKPCKYFDQGRGDCPFGSSCFYRHALPDGTLDISTPVMRYREDADGESRVIKSAGLNQFIFLRDAS